MNKNIRNLPSHFWHEANLNKVRTEMGDLITNNTSGKSIRERLKFILEQIKSKIEQSDAESATYAYVLIILALLSHEKHGGLNSQQINHLSKLGFGLLAISGVVKGRSKGSRLHGDLDIVLGQIQRRQGHHFEAVWLNLSSKLKSRCTMSDRQGFYAFSLGNRLQRLGYLDNAIIQYRLALLADDLSERQRMLCALELVRSLRLSGNIDIAEDESRNFWSLWKKTTVLEAEAVWEQMCRDCQSSGNFSKMLYAIKKSPEFSGPEFKVEGMLWLRIQRYQFQNDIPKWSTTKRKIRYSENRILYDSIDAIDNCYDSSIPLEIRIERLGNTLANCSKLLSLNHEVLVLAAATRFLHSSRSPDFFSLVKMNYQSKSLTLTSGRSKDCLGLLGNIFSKAEVAIAS